MSLLLLLRPKVAKEAATPLSIPLWTKGLYKPLNYKPLRYSPLRFKPPRYRKPF